jgi:tRNA A-37 threonylcarbamoyl transferase component Bud32/tetratricopeptide (TPR) repeat protein
MTLLDDLQAQLGDTYQIERELGGGGMSRVFLATETRLGRRVVIKVLSSELSATLSTERFAREIQLAASLQQANIVPVLAAGTAGDVPWFTMPYIDGESLRARLARGPLDEREAVSVLRDVTRALVYAHERGIVHRDIKPDNILLSGESAVVTDFGIAKAIVASRTGEYAAVGATITQVGTSIGTPTYMAPEQAAGDPSTDHRADLYALGCVAYELLTGAPPFAGRAVHELLRAHIAEVPAPVSRTRTAVSPALDTLIRRLLEKNPSERPATAREVLGALEAAATGAASGAVPAATRSATRSLSRALSEWALGSLAAYVLARAAVVGIGVPTWTVPLVLGLIGLGLPVVLFTWYVQTTARRALADTPPRTPGGTPTYGTMANMAIKASPHVSFSRARRLGLVAGGAVVMGVTVVLVLRQFGIGPAASLLAAGRVRADSRLLVADFTSTAGDSTLGGVIAQAMRTAMSQSSAVEVVRGTDVADALRRMMLSPTARLDERTARGVAARVGAPLLVTGAVTGVGSGFLVTANLVSTDSNLTLTTIQKGAKGADDLLNAVDAVARELRSRLGESLRVVAQAPALADVTTGSLDALREYTTGMRLGDFAGDFAAAMPHIDRAVALDSTFSEAWRKKASYGFNVGRPLSEQAHAAAMAYQFRERLAGPEREEVEMYFLRDRSTRGAIAAYDRMSPRLSRNNLAVLFREQGRFDRALAVANADIARDSAAGQSPISQLYLNRATAFIGAGKFTEARAALADMERRFPTGYYNEVTAAWITWAAGGIDSLGIAAERLVKARSSGARVDGAAMAAASVGARGRFSEFASALENGLRVVDSTTRAGQQIDNQLNLAVTSAVHRRDEADGVRVVDSLARATSQRAVPALDSRALEIATAYAQLGQPKAARKALDEWLAKASADDRLVKWNAWQAAMGEVALAEGRAADAIKSFRLSAEADSGHLEEHWTGRTALRLARAYDRAGERDSALTHFARYVDQRDLSTYMDLPLGLPIALRRLGELYEARGDTIKALDRYRAFVKLWANADPELQPQVTDVRQRIQRLEVAEGRKR